MTPLLTGVFASQISGHLTPPFTPTGSYDALATYTLSSTANYIDFIGIPSGYKHLQVRYWLPSTPSAGDSVYFNLGNGSIDTGNNYQHHGLYGYNGSGVVGGTYAIGAVNRIEPHYSANTNSIGTPFTGIIDILDYNSNAKYKTTRSFSGHQSTSAGATNYSQIWFVSGNWRNLNPVTSLRVGFGGPTGLPSTTKVSIYGIRG